MRAETDDNFILLFGGTTEGRVLSERLTAEGIAHTVCVATEYGEERVTDADSALVTVHTGRMDEAEIAAYLEANSFVTIVDATHPYAVVASKNIRSAAEAHGIPCLRVAREEAHAEVTGKDGALSGVELIKHRMKKQEEAKNQYRSAADCAAALKDTTGRILLTTGSKEIAAFTRDDEMRPRLMVRVLPSEESIRTCLEHGLHREQILAMQGPFSEELNLAILHQYDIRHLVTKESGTAGGFEEKVSAAEKADAKLYVILRPSKESGISVEDALQQILEVVHPVSELKVEVPAKTYDTDDTTGLTITLAGAGMGSVKNLTEEVFSAIERAEVLFGADRVLNVLPKALREGDGQRTVIPSFQPEEILSYLKQHPEAKRVTVLYSGDSGFYSGASRVANAVHEAVRAGELQAECVILPGISSISYLAAKSGARYDDAFLLSLHGRPEAFESRLLYAVRYHENSFVLLSGIEDLHRLGQTLVNYGFTDCTVTAGYQMSLPEEEILVLTAEDCTKREKEGLYTCLIHNPSWETEHVVPGTKDADFERSRVPMTKEEVRTVSVSKLHLTEKSVVYDIGSGTGSVAVEIASTSPTISVYAVEEKEEACNLIAENIRKFRTPNITLVKGHAPEALKDLPVPTHAFIGGSGGNLPAILSLLQEKNPFLRIVVTAISLETIAELKELLSGKNIHDEEILQMQIARSRLAGRHHMMLSENPVFIFAFTLGEV